MIAWVVIAVCAIIFFSQALAGTGGKVEEGTRVSGTAAPRPTPGTPANSMTPGPASPAGPPSAAPTRVGQPPATHTEGPQGKPPARPVVRISSPGQRSGVSGQAGVLLTGTAAGLGGDQLRVFVFAEDRRYYAATGGVRVERGHWAVKVGRIGSGRRDVGSIFVLVVARADATCRRTLAAASADADGNIAFPGLPAGCREAGSVSVVKTGP